MQPVLDHGATAVGREAREACDESTRESRPQCVSTSNLSSTPLLERDARSGCSLRPTRCIQLMYVVHRCILASPLPLPPLLLPPFLPPAFPFALAAAADGQRRRMVRMMREQRRGAMAGWMERAAQKMPTPPAVRPRTWCGPLHRRKARAVHFLARARTARPLPAPRVPTTARSRLPFTVSCSRASRALVL